jgi:acyl carrier protein
MRQTRPDTWSRLLQILVEEGIITQAQAEGRITRKTKLHDDLDMDSLDRYEFGYATEETFGVSIPDEDMDAMGTMGEYEDYINRIKNPH